MPKCAIPGDVLQAAEFSKSRKDLSGCQHWANDRLYDRIVLDDPFPEPVQLPIEDVIDLHSVPPRDVEAVVEEYLSEANRHGLKQLRIIHGRGIGVQREIVRKVLARTSLVRDYGDAPAEAGGWGATIVTLL
jgi:hypothetical protein